MANPSLPALQELVSQKIYSACLAEQPLVALEQAMEASFSQAETMLVMDCSGQRNLIACAPGCGHCCVVNVSLSIPEALAIAMYLHHLPKPLIARQREKLDQLWLVIRGLDDEERLACKRSCAFLGEDLCCSIYPVRPLLCRSVTSTAVQHCLDALQLQVFGSSSQVLMHQFQQQLYETIFVGVTTGLARGGWDDRSFQLTGLVRYLLQQNLTDSAAAAVLLGKKRLKWADLYP